MTDTMDHIEKAIPTTTAGSVHTTSQSSTSPQPHPSDEEKIPEFMPMYHIPTHHHGVELEDYFKGPRDIYHHSKWPYFLQMHGSILPKMIVPLTFIGGWATAITCISKFVHPLGINSVLLTVTGFVVGLGLSFRSSTAYERYSEGRKYWAQLVLSSRNLSRIIWIHASERHSESPELGKTDLLSKLAAMNLLNAFAVSLKHHLRFEPSVEYPDLHPLISHLNTFAGSADQTPLQSRKPHPLKSTGEYLGLTMFETNPRYLLKSSKENLGNTPLEILTYLSSYLDSLFTEKLLINGLLQSQALAALMSLTEVLTGCERVVNTPLPIAYTISISQITWAYVLALPFQLVNTLGWVCIPGTLAAAYIILGLSLIGRELENPFGQDVNDLPLDSYCHELAGEIDVLTSSPAKGNEEWMRGGSGVGGGAKVLWPLSSMEFKGWEGRSMEEIREALRCKSLSRDVKTKRSDTFQMSSALTNSS